MTPPHDTRLAPLLLLRARLHPDPAQALARWLEQNPDPLLPNPVLTLHTTTGRACLDVYLPVHNPPGPHRLALRTLLRTFSPRNPWRTQCLRLPPQAWTESWKKFFLPRRVSPRLAVGPPWKPPAAPPHGVALVIEPGMGFGTGSHPTTRACLQLIDRLAHSSAPGSFLDAGCGSGILAIAAARLGYAPVTAFDNDRDALRLARRNAHANGVSRAVRPVALDLAQAPDLPKHDVVAANILAHTLIDNAPALAPLVAPGGHLILSGILAAQWPAVRDAYRSLGFRTRRVVPLREWTSACLRAPAARPTAPMPPSPRA